MPTFVISIEDELAHRPNYEPGMMGRPLYGPEYLAITWVNGEPGILLLEVFPLYFKEGLTLYGRLTPKD